ncbi:hypothetical protein [Cellulomonas wangsupingiae]|uniref:DUF4393 domain-containing protein n=1 Tax=Cellulomonas wangsupingiae TaxID=2968085 RepID=A0ABY5K0J0_9CELL|nr:hypothetical protein [Cellulomonas wangsupingiae]MCC2333426.1 hypothetical protein [Cellulomonas wangsupingiae]UUI63613.1 hypothetical protein NP075_10670 [Cellulomonas wangsupingiae]
MDDQDAGNEGGNPWTRATIEGVASAAGALVGSVGFGPTAGVVGALVPPYALAALDTFGARWSSHRKANAAQVLIGAADKMGSIENVLLACESPAKEILTGIALNAGASTAMQGKIRALGMVLGRALKSDDDALVDESALMVAALADVEVPHVRLLDTMARPFNAKYPPNDPEGWSFIGRFAPKWERRRLDWKLPQYGVAMDGVLAALERHGLIAEVATDVKGYLEDQERRAKNALYPIGATNPAPSWKVTEFGASLLAVLYEAGEPCVGQDAGGGAS